ncbi:hypothetical protein Sjap_019287 [Stephania japonica]|uniref:Uncharacterized protein n=1 Tax=Stephania japonica TaxID=461633 RepID=A0AAP0F3S2_9MAGN
MDKGEGYFGHLTKIPNFHLHRHHNHHYRLRKKKKSGERENRKIEQEGRSREIKETRQVEGELFCY